MSATLTTPVASRSRGRRLGSKLGLWGTIAAVVVVLAAVIAVIGPWITPYDPTFAELSNAWIGPGGGHLLGYDVQGRDVLSRLLAGARPSMLGALMIVLICMAVGSALALVSAWRRGFTDTAVSSGMDILFAFPAILLAALTAAVFGPSLWAAVLSLAVAYTPYVARVLRGAMLRERNQQYIAALEVQGSTGVSICLRHLLPNVLPLIVAQATILFGYAVLDLAVVSYLGLGVQPPNPDWGVMISENQSGILQSYPLPAFSAGACIVAVVVAMNLLGERLLERSGAASR